MKNVKPFGGSGSYPLVTGTSYKDTDLINIPEGGFASFCAKIDTAGITVTPTLYLYYGEAVGFGNAQTIYDRNNSDASTFTSTAAFECSINKQAGYQAAIGFKIRFTFATAATGATLTCDAVTSGEQN